MNVDVVLRSASRRGCKTIYESAGLRDQRSQAIVSLDRLESLLLPFSAVPVLNL